MTPWLTRFAKALLVVTTLAVAGCASFPGNNMSKRGYDGLSSTQAKAVVDYDVNWTSTGERNYTANYWFSEQVKSVLEKSGIFASHTLDGKDAPLHFSMKMVSGLSLTLIPVFATDNYELTINVRSGDRTVKQYAYNDQMTTWFQFLLIFAFPSHKPGKVSHEIAENMLLHFLHDAQNDGVFNRVDWSVSTRGGEGS